MDRAALTGRSIDHGSGTRANQGRYPEGDAYRRFLQRRKRTGSVWNGLFLLSTIIGVLVLVVLVVDVVDDAFGYVALQNRVDPEALVLNYYKQKMTTLPKTLASEDDAILAKGRGRATGRCRLFRQCLPRAEPRDAARPAHRRMWRLARKPWRRTRTCWRGRSSSTRRRTSCGSGHRWRLSCTTICRPPIRPATPSATSRSPTKNWLLSSPVGVQMTGLTTGHGGHALSSQRRHRVTGSSTVAPLTEAVAAAMQATGRFNGTVGVDCGGHRRRLPPVLRRRRG
jgi:hypothetical protein